MVSRNWNDGAIKLKKRNYFVDSFNRLDKTDRRTDTMADNNDRVYA